MKAPILEFFDEPGIIDESKYVIADRVALLESLNINTTLFVFTRDIYAEIEDVELLEEFFDFNNASGSYKCYLYNKKFVIAISPVGAPPAGALMELLGFMGIKYFFACGSSGRIAQDVGVEFILVEKAIRCEGVSYRYAKPSLYAQTCKVLTNHIAKYLEEKSHSYQRGITWTTDSYFRETKSEIDLRKSQGAVCVEMESSAWCSIAKYRGYKFAQLLYFSDSVKEKGWELFDTIHLSRKAIISLMIDCVEKFVNKKK